MVRGQPQRLDERRSGAWGLGARLGTGLTTMWRASGMKTRVDGRRLALRAPADPGCLDPDSREVVSSLGGDDPIPDDHGLFEGPARLGSHRAGRSRRWLSPRRRTGWAHAPPVMTTVRTSAAPTCRPARTSTGSQVPAVLGKARRRPATMRSSAPPRAPGRGTLEVPAGRGRRRLRTEEAAARPVRPARPSRVGNGAQDGDASPGQRCTSTTKMNVPTKARSASAGEGSLCNGSSGKPARPRMVLHVRRAQRDLRDPAVRHRSQLWHGHPAAMRVSHHHPRWARRRTHDQDRFG